MSCYGQRQCERLYCQFHCQPHCQRHCQRLCYCRCRSQCHDNANANHIHHAIANLRANALLQLEVDFYEMLLKEVNALVEIYKEEDEDAFDDKLEKWYLINTTGIVADAAIQPTS